MPHQNHRVRPRRSALRAVETASVTVTAGLLAPARVREEKPVEGAVPAPPERVGRDLNVTTGPPAVGFPGGECLR